MLRPLIPLEKELARCLVLTESKTTLELATRIAHELPTGADAAMGAQSALKLVYGLLRALQVTPECEGFCDRCFPGCPQGSPSHATPKAPDGCLGCVGLCSEPITLKNPEPLPLNAPPVDAERLRQLLVLAFLPELLGERPSICTQRVRMHTCFSSVSFCACKTK